MKKTDIITFLLAAAMLLPAIDLFAESGMVSPYSRFGYGLKSDQANTAQRAMGGVGYAMRSGREINFMNPASYAAIDSLTFLFDMGVDMKKLRTTDNGEKGSNFTGGLDYLALQFPVTKWLGMSAGLLPYSEVGYSFGRSITNGIDSHNGSGGLNLLYVGVGVKPFKGLTLGANVSYMFGTITNDTYIYGASTSLFERVTEVRDYDLRLGAQYGMKVAPDHELTLGVVYAPEKDLRGSTYGEVFDVSSEDAGERLDEKKLKGNARVAATYGVGLNYSWQGGRFMAEVDYTYEPWKGVKFAHLTGFNDDFGNFNNRTRLGMGVQFRNKVRGSWLQRVSYRAGAFLSTDYIKVGDNSVRERGASVGLGLPAPLSKTMINLTFEYRNRKAHPQPLVKENYFVVTLGINFNELWFFRNKLN